MDKFKINYTYIHVFLEMCFFFTSLVYFASEADGYPAKGMLASEWD